MCGRFVVASPPLLLAERFAVEEVRLDVDADPAASANYNVAPTDRVPAIACDRNGLQLIGGVVILQALPAIVLGLWRTIAHRWALLAGWLAGMTAGLLLLYNTANATTGKEHFGGPTFPLAEFGLDTELTLYTGLIALVVNLFVVVVGSLVLRALKAPAGEDVTRPGDYEAEAGDPRVEPLPGTPEQELEAERESAGRFKRHRKEERVT
jgi:SSS family solute:Na+ symporter